MWRIRKHLKHQLIHVSSPKPALLCKYVDFGNSLHSCHNDYVAHQLQQRRFTRLFPIQIDNWFSDPVLKSLSWIQPFSGGRRVSLHSNNIRLNAFNWLSWPGCNAAEQSSRSNAGIPHHYRNFKIDPSTYFTSNHHGCFQEMDSPNIPGKATSSPPAVQIRSATRFIVSGVSVELSTNSFPVMSTARISSKTASTAFSFWRQDQIMSAAPTASAIVLDVLECPILALWVSATLVVRLYNINGLSRPP